MPLAHVDFNRGNDTTGTGAIGAPFKTLSKVANWSAGAGGGVLLARDSVFDVAITTASSGQVGLTSAFNGVDGNRAILGAYDPPGAGSLTSKPTIRRRMFPTTADWQWDATDNFGSQRGWYIQFAYGAAFWDARVIVAGQVVETTNQNTDSNTGKGYINGTQNGSFAGTFVNGMTLDTLRFNFDYGGLSVGGQTGARLYLSGAGLRTPGAGNDPSSVMGPGQIEIAFGWMFSLYDAGSHLLIENLRIESGGGLFLFQGTANTIKGGLEVTGCESYDTSIPIRLNNGTGTQEATVWPFDIHHNTFQRMTGPSFTAFGAGITGSFRSNVIEDGNLGSSMGGGVYMQVKQSTYGGVNNPFRVSDNIARRWKNGAGNNEFDGCCYYIDLHDDGTVLERNRAEDSYVGVQVGSGRKARVYANQIINCEQMIMANNATSVDTNDYHIAHNLYVAAARGTYGHGETANVHQYHAPMYHSGTAGNLVGIRFDNNIMVNHPNNTSEVPVLLGRSSDWPVKHSAKNNLFKGYGAVLVRGDMGSVNMTSSAQSLSPDTVLTFAGGDDFRPGAGCGVIGQGAEVANGITDAAGEWYFSPPTIGPYEVPRLRRYFGHA